MMTRAPKFCNKKYRSPCMLVYQTVIIFIVSHHFVNVRALITGKIMCSKDAQCKTEESH